MKINNILFDLDGTLLDTAPDLASALNSLLEKYGMIALPHPVVRPTVSHGSKGMLKLAFDIEDDHENFNTLREELLNIYAKNVCVNTVPFPGIEDVLEYIKENKLSWGIVTNKPGFLTEPLLKNFAFNADTKCVVSGDTVENAKPHPEPLLHACKLMKCEPKESLYIGDAERDIEAGRRAGMTTLIARYGYISEEENIDDWNAHGIIDDPKEIITWLEKNKQ